MNRVRYRRPRRRDITPLRAVFIYGLAFLLAGWHQSARVAEWLENQALEREGRLSENALLLAVLLREKVCPYGPAQINQFEDRFLARLAPETEIGAFRPPAPRPVPDQREEREEGEAEARPAGPDPEAGPPTEKTEADPAAGPQTEKTGPDPEAEPDLWLGQVNPDESPPGAPREVVGPPEAALPETVAPASPPRFGKVLLLGDSMMLEGLGPQLQKELLRRHEGLTVERDGRYGTGLTRLDYFDWLDFFERMLEKYGPDLVILTVGANDPQDILDPEGPPGRRRILMGTGDWNEIYAARVAGLLKMAEGRGVRVFWVGLPIMGREPYASRVADINAVAAAGCAAAANCRFWDSWRSVADSRGRFTSYIQDENGRRLRLRGRDFVHLTEEGGRIMAQKFLAETEGWADYQAPAAPGEGEPPTVEPPTVEPPTVEPPTVEPPTVEPPTVEPPTVEPPTVEPPTVEPPATERREVEQPVIEPPVTEQPATGQPDVEWFPGEPPTGLTPLGVPPLPPARPPLDDPPPWSATPEPGQPAAPEPEELDEDDFVDPLPVEDDLVFVYPPVKPELRPDASAGGGAFVVVPQPVEDEFSIRPLAGEPAKKPVVLLLHGAWDSAASWERELGRETLQALADRLGIILALPEGGPFGWYLDGLEAAAETFILDEFLPEVLKRAESDPARLAVAGLSMGGHGALTLALKRPDLFRAAAALSAVTDLAAHAGAHKLDSELAIDRVLGPAGPEGRNWRPFGAAGLWEARAGAWNGRPLFLGVGSADGLTLAENRAFTRQLTRLGIDHVYQEKPGGHDWGYWSAELPILLEFLAQGMALDPNPAGG